MRRPYMGVELGMYGYELGIFALLLLAIISTYVWYRKRNFSYFFCFVLFGVYLVYALDKVFFPLPIRGSYADALREYAAWSENINLNPFYFGRFGNFQSSLETMFLNILLTIPFGFGISFLVQLRAKQFLWLAPALGIGIELAQLIISLLLLFPYRTIDINDVFMNMLGVWIGYGGFRLFAWLYLWLLQRLKLQPWGIFAYFHHVAAQS